MKKYIVILILVGAVFFSWIVIGMQKTSYVKIGGQKINVEIARTAEEKTKGLSGHAPLLPNQGMLFVFENEGVYPFWMKDMAFPIDIIWIAENNTVAYIQKDAQPESYPEIFDPGKKAKYVLEVPADFAQENNLKEGDKANIYLK